MADNFNPNQATLYGLEINPSGTTNVDLISSLYRAAGQIIPTANKTVNTLEFENWGHGGAFVELTVELQSDNAGSPSGTVLGSGVVTPGANFTWQSVAITPVAVTGGTKYWVVVYGLLATGVNHTEIRAINDPAGLIIPSKFLARTSTNAGVSYADTSAGYGLCVGLGYSDATFEGLGYGDLDILSVGATDTNNEYGQKFTSSQAMYATAITIPVKRSAASPDPTDVLTYYIYDVTTTTMLQQGTLLGVTEGSTSFVWYSKALSPVVTIPAAHIITFGVLSNATAATRWNLSTPKTTNTGNGNAMTFGAAAAVRVLGPNNATPDATKDFPGYLTYQTTDPSVASSSQAGRRLLLLD